MYQKVGEKLNALSFNILVAVCALLPVFFLPVSYGGLGMVKGVLLYGGVFLSVSFWFVAQFVQGSFRIPRSRMLFVLAAWVVLSLVGALVSSNQRISLWGQGFSLDSFATTLVTGLLVFLTAVFSSDQRRSVKIFLATFLGAVVTMLLQVVLYVTKGTAVVSQYFAHVASQGTLVGSWVDFAYFVVFVFILGLLLHEVLIPKGAFKKLAFIAIVASLLCLVFLNFKAAWIITGIASLLVFVYKSSVERSLMQKYPELVGAQAVDESAPQKIPLFSFVALLIALFFFLSSGSVGALIAQKAGISFSNIRPSFGLTTNVMRHALYKDPLFGPGAGLYADTWNLYHTSEVNQTLFWNTSFDTGFNYIQSVFTTNGILPAVALIVLIALSIAHGVKLFGYAFPDRFSRFIAVTSLIMIIATACLMVFGAPGMILIVYGFLYVGILAGVSSLVGKTKITTVEYLKDPRLSFFMILGLVIATMASFSAVYFTGNKFASIVLYSKTLNAPSVQAAQVTLNKALALSQNDEYWRARTNLYINEFTQQAKEQNADKTALQSLFTQAEQSAQAAVSYNSKSATNWLLLSQVYQLISGGQGSDDAFKNAVAAGQEAQRRNPNNPLFYLNNAQIALIAKDTTGALDSIGKALALKSNYLDAYVLRGQIRQSKGEAGALKEEVQAYIAIAPFDDQGYLALGAIYQDAKDYTNAIAAYDKARNVTPTNLNAHVSYISALESAGQNDKAVDALNVLKRFFPRVGGIDEQIQRLQGIKAAPQQDTTSAETPKKK